METHFIPTSDQPLILGVIREGKVPPDARVPLTPSHCVALLHRFPQIQILVQPSAVRRIKDSEYVDAGIEVQEDLSSCHVLLGVKEVPLDELMPDKTYLFFSHTYKLQPYNAKLLAEVLKRRIRLIDYEMLRRPSGKRIIGFGRWAGLVGAYNGFRALGERTGMFQLKPASECRDLAAMLAELSTRIKLPSSFKIVLTGSGRVGEGAKEVLDHLKLRHVHPEDFLRMSFPEPVYTRLDVEDYNAHNEGKSFTMQEFKDDPTSFHSTFPRYAHVADLFIAGHFWAEGSPFLFTRSDMRHPGWRVSTVADVSCDIDGPVACTLRPSTIADPFYGYDPVSESEANALLADGITVMAVDNLPCELPRDASEGFGQDLVDHVLPLLIEGDRDGILFAATETTLEGELNAPYAYLSKYAGVSE
jgi:saccharopine dehydrogenase (NAD+, L-lysine-forming)